MEIKKRSFDLQAKILQKISTVSNRVKKESGDTRAMKYLLNSKSKEKQIYERLFSIYNAEVAHFLY
jgi:macrodomain Ter protein organizer (MatP/YcbG family)